MARRTKQTRKNKEGRRNKKARRIKKGKKKITTEGLKTRILKVIKILAIMMIELATIHRNSVPCHPPAELTNSGEN